MLQASNERKAPKATGPSHVALQLIAASGEVRIHVVTEICQSPEWFWNECRMGCRYSGSDLNEDRMISGSAVGIELQSAL